MNSETQVAQLKHSSTKGRKIDRANANPSDLVNEAAAAMEKAKPIRTGPKVGRNDPCPCKSGKKYKQCCGK